MKSKHISILLAAVSVALILVFPLQILSADSVFNFATDISGRQTTTIKVTGEGHMDLPPDAVFIRLDTSSPPSGNLTKVMENQSVLVNEIITSLEDAGVTEDDMQVSRANNARIYTQQSRIADPNQSSYAIDFRVPVKVPYEQSSSIFKDITGAGFAIDDVRILQIQEKSEDDVESSNSATISIPQGTSVPSCEETNSCYVPYEIVISPGTQVTWTNNDEAAHTVTSGAPEDGPDGTFDSALFMTGASFSHTFSHSGEYPYFCMVHPWMIGKVTVSGNASVLPQEYGMYAEFNVFLQSHPQAFDDALSVYQNSIASLSAILEKHGLDTDTLQDRPIRIDERFRGYGEPFYYEARDYLMIRTPIDNIYAVLDVAVKHNSQIEDISPTYLPSTLESVRTDLTKMALDDAKTAVVDLIEPDGLEIKGVKSIEVNTESLINPQYEGIVIHGVGISMERNYYNLDPLFTKVQVEFEVGR